MELIIYVYAMKIIRQLVHHVISLVKNAQQQAVTVAPYVIQPKIEYHQELHVATMIF